MFYKNSDTDFWDVNDDNISNEQLNMRDESYYVECIVKVKARLDRVMFPKPPLEHEDNEFAIAKMRIIKVLEEELHPLSRDRYNSVSVKGNMPKLSFDNDYELTIQLDEVHPKYGASYMVKFVKHDFEFKNENDTKIFLSKILTQNQIDNLYKVFKDPLIPIKNSDIDALITVKGIGESTAESIISRYMSTIDYAEAYVELDGYGLTTNAIIDLSRKLGSPNTLINKIKENPYMLATEIKGYGFKKADEIAQRMGFSNTDTKRITAFINYILDEMGEKGYSWIESSHLIFLIEETLGEIDMSLVLESVNILRELKSIWNEEKGKIGSMRLYTLELNIVKELVRLKEATVIEAPLGWRDRVKEAEILQGWEYTDEQINGIEHLLNENIGIVLGLSGSGKTSTALGLIKATDIEFVGMCCLSGKASARLQEATGYPTSTIHRLLGVDLKGGFQHDENCQLPHDLIILDEYSLVGGDLFYALIKAIESGSRFFMLGDFGQLSSIGSMNIAMDTSTSNCIPKAELTKIHRQAQKSAIITESIKARFGIQLFEKGWVGQETRGELQDLELDVTNDKTEIPKMILKHFKKYQESEKDIMEIQIISPMNLRGDSSSYEINKMIQRYYNPISFDDDTIELTAELNKTQFYNFRVGDKVINIKNNYRLKDEKGKVCAVFNGYTGVIEKIIGTDIYVKFPLVMDSDELIIIDKKHWMSKKGLHLGYCSSTHKNQGSGFNKVIYVIDNSHHVMLCRQQIYTGLTRAREHCTLVGQSSAIWKAISIDEVSDKQTFLKDLLIDKLKRRE